MSIHLPNGLSLRPTSTVTSPTINIISVRDRSGKIFFQVPEQFLRKWKCTMDTTS
jgi:hypothetical protein